MNKNSITHQQFTKIVALDIIGVSILSVPSIVIDIAKQDAWIAALLASFFGLLLAGLLYLFGRLFTGQTLIQFCQHLLGKYLGNGIALLYIFFFFYRLHHFALGYWPIHHIFRAYRYTATGD